MILMSFYNLNEIILIKNQLSKETGNKVFLNNIFLNIFLSNKKLDNFFENLYEITY